MKTARLEAFSDGVFAIAITLLIIEIKVPEDTSHLLTKLGELWPSYLGFVISFLVIGLIWANHHAMFDHIVTADRTLLFLNTVLLMLVVFIPFSAGVLAAAFRTGESERTSVVLYGVVLVAGGIPFNAIWEYARRNHRLLGPSITPAEAKRIARRFYLGPVLYGVGTLLGALVPALGIAVFALLIPYYWLPPAMHWLRKPQPAQPAE
ncbi:putative membrane protein [Kribbella voronezhensis]|uniref:Putative membrane protein n=1 Tax=Kribbella voronezhensis TaxID=2512212 RepID=A0A4R7TFS7_9ACTN|nr:TMEM175 family protein [Kribbella voronezhensis]TDU90689.1 putative membrane protein [Kribbella voronezhensis]